MTEEQQTNTPDDDTAPARPVLPLSAKARIWGQDEDEAVEPALSPEARKKVFRGGNDCYYCGLPSQHNHVHNLNDNHSDTSADNLRPACPLCHAWSHLEALTGKAHIRFLPGMSAQDINHLQRATLIAMQLGDETMRKDAQAVHKWLDERLDNNLHLDIVERCAETNEPAAFAEAISQIPGDLRANKDEALENLAVIFDPKKFPLDKEWVTDVLKDYPMTEWPRVYQDTYFSSAV